LTSGPTSPRRAGGLADTLRVFRGLLGERRFVGCTLASGLAFAAMFAYIAGSPFVLQDIYSLSPAQFSADFAANAIGMIVAGQVSSRLIARLGPRPVFGAGLVIGAVGGVALLAVVLLGGIGLVGILPAFFLVVSSIGVVFPSGAAIALDGHPSTAGSASALLGLAIGASSAPLVGVAGKGSALPMAIVIVTCGLGAVAAFWLLVRPQPARRRAAAAPARNGRAATVRCGR
jgi:DHA1 family bicyclomycin/chloramphenicol resistance-like MFS transporter